MLQWHAVERSQHKLKHQPAAHNMHLLAPSDAVARTLHLTLGLFQPWQKAFCTCGGGGG